MRDPLEDAYRALAGAVEAFTEEVRARGPGRLRCGAGCAACCQAGLSVSGVEAARVRAALEDLDIETLAALEECADERVLEGRCALLQEERCAIYAARPMVCRSQGLPLRYPSGTLEEEAVMAVGEESEVTWCPLNFQGSPPAKEDVIDAERVDVGLAQLQRAYASREGRDPHERQALRALLHAAHEARSVPAGQERD